MEIAYGNVEAPSEGRYQKNLIVLEIFTENTKNRYRRYIQNS